MTLREIKDRLKRKKFMLPALYLWRAIKKVCAYVSVSLTLRKLTAAKNPDELYLILNTGMGDSLYGMAFIEAVLEKYSDRKIIVIANPKHENLLKTYPANEQLIFRFPKSWNRKKIGRFIHFPGLAEKAARRDILVAFSVAWHKSLMLQDNLSTIYQLRKNVFGLPDDAKITYHGLKYEPVNVIRNFTDIADKIVVLNPYSVSMHSDISIYENLCEELLRRNFIVYTNIINEQQPVKGTLPLRCTLQELFSIACKIPLFVSVRSGMLDLMIPSGVSMFVVYDQIRERKMCIEDKTIEFYDWFHYYRLADWESNCKLCEVVVDAEEDTELLPGKLSAFLDELKQEGRIS